MKIAIIPARSGSKRIKQKNIRTLAGKPVITRTIENLRSYDIFDRLIVTTDCKEIASVARKAGAEIPFLRAARLSDDQTPTLKVIQDSLLKLDKLNMDASVCCVYPIACLMQKESFLNSYQLLEANPTKFVIALQQYKHPIDRSLNLYEDHVISPLDATFASTRTQDCVPKYHDAGQFYWAKKSIWLESEQILRAGEIGYELSQTEAVDVDTMDDWKMFEALFLYKENYHANR